MEGISINTQTERKVDTVLASLMGALVAYGGNSPREVNETPILPPETDDLVGALRLIGRLTPPLEAARGLAPEEAARAIHGAMEDASRETVRMLLSSISQYAPREGETAAAILASSFRKLDSRVPRRGIFCRDACPGCRAPDVS